MESGLLSSFHDDHFDGNYSKYDSLDVWSERNDGMGLQLSETLRGILPITGNEEASHFFETDLEHRIPFRFETENDDLTGTIIEMDKNIDEDYLLTSYEASDDICESMSPSIEIISVDPNCEFSSPITIDDVDEELDQDDDEEDANTDGCSSRSSNYSSNSSIADYESHSSDDSDDVEKRDIKKVTMKNMYTKSINKFEANKIIKSTRKQNNLNMKYKSDTPCNTRVSSSADPLREETLILKSGDEDKVLKYEIMNMKTFDLASYITQDNYELLEPNERPLINDKANFKYDNHINDLNFSMFNTSDIKSECKSDSDTEIIVDIETVHDFEEDVKPMLLRRQNVDYSSCLDVNEPLAKCDDDIKHDPSWSPKKEKATKLCKPKTKPQTKQKRTNNLISRCNRILNANSSPINQPNKCHFVMDRKKYGLGKGKNISMCTTPEIPESVANSDADDSTDHDDSTCKKETRIGLSETKCAIDSNKLTIRISNLNGQPVLQNSNEKNAMVDFIPKADIKTEYPQPIIKQEHTAEPKTEKYDIKLEPQACSDDESKIDIATSNAQTNAEVTQVVPVKKKLNLEEYKRRRENQLIGDTKIKKTLPCDPIPPKMHNTANRKHELKSTKVVPTTNNSGSQWCKPLLLPGSQKQCKSFYDPILEAKNKVLRMQELKKAAIGKRIDSAVSAKVGPITPILPLEQICGGIKPYNDSANKLNPEYEEIIIVSASCNTEITLAPVYSKQVPSVLPSDQKVNYRTDVVNPNSLLSNINNSMTKSNCVRLSSNSLLSSIQDVVLKQSTTNLLNGNSLSQKSPNIGVSPPSQFSPQKPEMSHTEEMNILSTNNNETEHGNQTEHGEDKIIMHLRKDRIRKRTFSVCTQTEDLPQFPPIKKLIGKTVVSRQSTNPKKRKRQYRSRRHSSVSSSENDGHQSSSRSFVRYHSVSSHGTNRSVSPRSPRYSYSRGRRTASPYHKVRRRSSRSTSRVKYDSDTSTSSSDSGRRSRSRKRRTRRYSSSHSSSSGSSSSSTSSSRSGSRSPSPRSRSRYSNCNYATNLNRRNSSPAVEERRIVYVGRIERETSKEDLKRKFNSYGPIKQITVHYKDTGMKYGFVTFEKPQDAYQVIDRSLHDPRINMYDISFGGRRAFCRQTYSDLDGAATNSFQDMPYSLAPPRTTSFKEDSFESLLAKVKEKLTSSKASTSPSSSTTSSSRCKT